MASKVIMPAFGTTQETGVLLKWLKREGDLVAQGEPLMEVETDKSTVEVAAPLSGTLLKQFVAEGAKVPVGQIVGFIGAPGEALPSQTLATVAAKSAVSVMTSNPRDGDGGITSAHELAPSPVGGVPTASPAARKFARENGLALSSVQGSGPSGAVLLRDLKSNSSDAILPVDGAATIVPLTAMRRVISARMSASKQSAPHFYLTVDVDMTTAMAQRQHWKDTGVALLPSINDLIIFACAMALREFPVMNSQYHKQGIQQLDAIHIGFAVTLDDGLVVPVVRFADRLSLPELASQTRQLIDKAQNKKLMPADYDGGTFTISNLGMLGVDSFTAIINPPQCAILAVGRVAPRVVADDDAMAIRQMMTITLSADHRVTDGAVGARFLQSIKAALEVSNSTVMRESQ